MDLKIVLGTVNYTDYLRVSAAKVSDPSTEVFVEYINTPITNYTLVIPNLDADNYYISFRDAPDTGSLGTLVSQAFVNALTGQWEYEKRFYIIGSLPSGVTSDDTKLTDPYLADRDAENVEVFKEGFRWLNPDNEYTVNDSVDGQIVLLNSNFSDGETVIVKIKHNVGTSTTTTATGDFTETISVTGATYSVDAADKYKRHSLDCAGSKQEVTMCPLSSCATGDFFVFEHNRTGTQIQTRIILNGTDKILFNGFGFSSNELGEIWVHKGQRLKLRKESSYWEVINDYNIRVGERMASGYLSHPNWLPEDGRLIDGDEYPGLYYWVKNVLPSTHKITDDTVVSGGYTHPSNKRGLFVIHSTLAQFRMPNTQALSEKGLADFDSYGADTERGYDYPGGEQSDQNKAHGHQIRNGSGGSSTNPLDSPTSGFSGMDSLGAWIGSDSADSTWVKASGGAEVRVKNIGVIYMRHI